MQQMRHKIKMMSVNQMTVYHKLSEAYNVMRNSSSEQIKLKWEKNCESQYSLRSIARNDLDSRKANNWSFYILWRKTLKQVTKQYQRNKEHKHFQSPNQTRLKGFSP